MSRMHRSIAGLFIVSLVAGCSGSGGGPGASGASGAAVASASGANAVPSVGVAATPSPAPTASHAPTAPASPSAKPAATPKASGVLYDPDADARAEIVAALAAAKADGKRVLLDFGADWCPDCHVLAAYLDGPAGRKLVDTSFHVVSIDVGYWDHNLDVSAAAGDPITKGIPAVVVVEADGTIVGSTADGSLANARTMTEKDVLAKLAAWAP